jgi:hypothetical protein
MENTPQTTKGLLLTLGATLSAGGFAFLASAISVFPINIYQLIAGLCLIGGAFVSFFVREKYKDHLAGK